MQRLILCLLLAVMCLVTQAQAATIWVNPSGSATAPYDTKATGLTTVTAGVSEMSSGDELIITDGTYTGAANMIDSTDGADIPSGTAGAYTIVRAENDFGVTVDAEQTAGRLPFKQVDNDYFQVQGILFKRPGDVGREQESSPVFLLRCDYVKMIRVGASECMEQTVDTVNMSNIFVVSDCTYGLLEECYSYGYGKYGFLLYHSDHMILRRCIGRHDGWSVGKSDIFSAYSSHDIVYQNCIALDYDQPRHWHPTSSGLWGGFNQNGASTADVSYQGCIVKNITGSNGVTVKSYDETVVAVDYNPAWKIDAGVDTTSLTNCLALDSIDGILAYGATTITNCTFINLKLDNSTDVQWHGRAIDHVSGSYTVVRNSIIYDMGRTGVKDTDSDYNAFLSNAANYQGSSAGTNDYASENGNEIDYIWSDSNPTGGLKYPVRVEANSNLSGIGSGGADVGANITKKIGVSGTLWGETGYLDTTDDDLWPFPNEAEIRADMKAYLRWDPYDNIDPGNSSNPDTWTSGDRGFCADGVTLTTYIWESLGNDWDGPDPPIDPPDDILKHPWQWNFKL